MQRNSPNRLLALLSLVVSAAQLFAQGTAFTYQGQLNDGTSPASGIYDLRFTIHDLASGGGALGGAVTNSATSVNNGLFTVTLNFGAAPFNGADRWLEIGVRTNGGGAFTTLSPRQAITATPYSIQSANASTAATVSGSVSVTQLAGTILSNNIGAESITTSMLAPGAVTTGAIADGAVTAAKMVIDSNWFAALTIANPTPAIQDQFGSSLAVVGNDRVLIGAYQDDTGGFDAGAAYLFNLNGTLSTTFTNPTPAEGDYFGYAVAPVGNDRVLIGAYQDDTSGMDAGIAYLFSTNGSLLMNVTNPTPAAGDFFGYSAAAVGNGQVLVGAYQDDTGAADAGSAYLFSTNGTLLTTFTNPAPAIGDSFGSSVAAVGNDRVMIGAFLDDTGANGAGSAYLFSTNGALLMTFTNPTPAAGDRFGVRVASMGNDRVLIGASDDDTGAGNAGAAYLFSVNGTLLTTFTNPAPAVNDYFGSAIAPVGSDRVLIGAYSDSAGAPDAGAAYLFSTNGTLLTTFTNPTPANGDFFGLPVASLGSDRVLIGAFSDSMGASDSGVMHLFSTETYAPGLVADAVRSGSIGATSFDATIGVWTRSGDNVFRPFGNVGIGTATPQQKLHVIGNIFATGSVTGLSDRNAKRDFAPVNSREVLEKVSALPLSTWSYIADDGVRHLGPMAQDFHSAFGVGMDDKTISMLDADGVALAAIQGLNQKLEEKLQQKEMEIGELSRRLEALETIIRRQTLHPIHSNETEP
ncbi:MAG TPA: tail fiber domain-containing protein [Verrucomicrobiae bacterium]|nr:tail fiber domain-containing protein [Verrucomicrobiae bacterium]